MSKLLDKYPAECAEMMLTGLDPDSYDFDSRVLLKVLEKRLVLVDVKDTVKGGDYKESKAPWLKGNGWKTAGDSVRVYGNTVTALVRFPVEERKVELLLEFLEALHGWKEKE